MKLLRPLEKLFDAGCLQPQRRRIGDFRSVLFYQLLLEGCFLRSRSFRNFPFWSDEWLLSTFHLKIIRGRA